jgi:diguanylate cyclase (GGDEF)-like protein
LLLIVDDCDDAAIETARRLGASAILRRDAGRVETIARLRAVSRLRMLRDEVASRGGAPFRTPRKRRVAATGLDDASGFSDPSVTLMTLERGPGAFIAAANGRCDAVLLSAALGHAECHAFISRMRAVASMRNIPALICELPAAEQQRQDWLDIGANDLLPADAEPAHLLFQLQAACERRDLLEALKRLARDAAKQTSEAEPAVDPVTGLAGQSAFRKALDASAKRMFAQGKAVSVLIISPDLAAAEQSLPDSIATGVADVLRRSLRGFDFASRITGTSFAILMPGVSGDDAMAAANRLCSAVAHEKIRLGDKRQSGLTCSIGVATATTSDESSDIAERAMNALRQSQAGSESKGVIARAA